MEIYFIILFFIMGIFFGSFFNVVGDRLPRGESIVFPPSHCNNCNHRLTPLELIPILSFILQGGKCRKCACKLSLVYPLYEIICGIVFVLSYLSFGLTPELIIVITFISMLLIIFVSDIGYMIISDEVLIATLILLIIETIFIHNLSYLFDSILNGIIAFIIMFLIKIVGDFLFKKESMGGGDIKLMFFFGFMLGWEMAIICIFIASFIALPVASLILVTKKEHHIPFGPFLNIAAILVLLLHIDITAIIKMII